MAADQLQRIGVHIAHQLAHRRAAPLDTIGAEPHLRLQRTHQCAQLVVQGDTFEIAFIVDDALCAIDNGNCRFAPLQSVDPVELLVALVVVEAPLQQQAQDLGTLWEVRPGQQLNRAALVVEVATLQQLGGLCIQLVRAGTRRLGVQRGE